MSVIFTCDIPYKTQIGRNCEFPHHALGIVIHPYAIIGDNCKFEQNVTIGGRSGLATLPRIGNNVMIGAGAVVVKDIPDNSVVMGVPAKIIKKDGVCI